MKKHQFSCSKRKRQQGVYVIEWAFVFPVFFVLLYALIAYGLAFLVRESMQLAAEDGARAALQFQPERSQRFEQAQSVVQQRLSWLPIALRPSTQNIQVSLCRLTGDATPICKPDLICGTNLENRCTVQVSFTIDYGTAPLAPPLPGLSLWMPDEMAASASILVDQGGI